MKIAIIGTGISGLSVARLLKGKHEVVLFEKNNKIGGLVKCERIKDCLFHKVGGHVFNSHNKKVLDWFWAHFDRDTEFVAAKRKAKVFFNNAVIGYPIENYLYLFEPPLVKEILAELIQLQQLPKKAPMDYPDFESFLQFNFGQTLYDIYFKPYNQKIWNADLSTVSMAWLEGKLPMPNLLEIVQNNVLRQEEAGMVHSTFYYPKEGGSQFIIDRLKKDLIIRTDSELKDLEIQNGKVIINNEAFDKLVYCGDIRRFPAYGKELMRSRGVDVNYLEKLRSNGTSNLFCETDDNEISWLYIPESFTKAHRIIYTGNFSDTNNRGSDRKTCVVEFSGQVEYEVMVEEIKKLPGNLAPLAYNYEPNSYVIQDHRTRKEISLAKEALSENNIYILGRFAEWEYYNMDKAVEAAMALADSIN